MKVFIVTRGRPDVQITADQLKAAGIDFTFACTKGDDRFPDGPREEFEVNRVGEKRQKVIESYSGKMVIIDDDVEFRIRVDKTTGKTRKCTPLELNALFAEIESDLDTWNLVGIADRFLIHTKPYPSQLNVRQLHFFAFNSTWLNKHEIRFDRLEVVEDLDFLLQFFAAGGIQKVRTDYCHEDKWYRGAGGCSIWRTNELHNKNVLKFKELWPDFISIRKEFKGLIQPTIQWRKAAKAGRSTA